MQTTDQQERRGGATGRWGPLRWSPAWCLEGGTDADGALVLSAGVDRRVGIDGLAPHQVARVRQWATGADAPDPTDDLAALVDRLVELRALVPAVAAAVGTVAIVADDDVGAALGAELRRVAVVEPADAEVVLVVRTGTTWPAERALLPAHALVLGVDLTLHHTIALGPLVVPGCSACLDCLDHRATARWGPPAVPDRPAVLDRLAVVAALLEVQLDLVGHGTSPLVNAVASWDLEQATTEVAHLYRVVGCGGCRPVPPSPRVHLGWAP